MTHPVDMWGSLPLVCLSHLRWQFVWQRPQHLLTRAAQARRVFYVEEPLHDADSDPWLHIEQCGGVTLAVPHLPRRCEEADAIRIQRALIDDMLASGHLDRFVLWYYTPMARAFTDHLRPTAIVYDCMDELSAFAHAPSTLRQREAELLRHADVVFTGGESLYEAKRGAHPNVHALPSSVDVDHFAAAREPRVDPVEQAGIGRPRLGFFGVIDERMDFDLLAGIAAARPEWQLVMIGPVAKIDPALLPRLPNIHYLGARDYAALPGFIGGWDVALLPFARNAATRYISPTKTPEYLAAGRPVVSTSIRDVVRPYSEQGLVRIADTVAEFIAACEAAMAEDAAARWRRADLFLSHNSWDDTWARMCGLLDEAMRRRHTASAIRPLVTVREGSCSTI